MKHIHSLQIIKESSDGILEVCQTCKKRVKTRKDPKGRINNREYLKSHLRDTAQPNGRTGKAFKKLYGEPQDFERQKSGIIKNIKDESQYNTELALEDIDREEVGSGKLVY